jgi:hypothetical protein
MDLFRSVEKNSEVIISSQPFDLGAGIPINDIALLVLETPGDDDEDVPFTNPDFLFDLPLDPSHPGDAVETPDTDMVRPHHQFGTAEHLTVPLLGQPDPDNLPGFIFLIVEVRQYTISPIRALWSKLKCSCLDVREYSIIPDRSRTAVLRPFFVRIPAFSQKRLVIFQGREDTWAGPWAMQIPILLYID